MHSPKRKTKRTVIDFPPLPIAKKCPVETYLKHPRTENLLILNDSPVLKEIFLRLNSNLPSRAPVKLVQRGRFGVFTKKQTVSGVPNSIPHKMSPSVILKGKKLSKYFIGLFPDQLRLLYNFLGCGGNGF